MERAVSSFGGNMDALKSALLTLRAVPYSPGRTEFQIRFDVGPSSFNQHEGGIRVDASVANEYGRGVDGFGYLECVKTFIRRWEVTEANIRDGFTNYGIGQAMYMIAAERVGSPICPNVTGNVSEDARRVWASLGKYGTLSKVTAPPNFDSVMKGDNASSFHSWDDVVRAGLDVSFSYPTPPDGYSSWKEFVVTWGGVWR